MNIEFQLEAQKAIKELSWWQKLRIRCGKKHYLGDESREGWPGKSPFYLFWCRRCGHFAKDYPNGLSPGRALLCSYCDVSYNFDPWWLWLAMLWAVIKIPWKYRKFGRA